VGIETSQLLPEMISGSRAARNDPVCPQCFQQPGERGLDLIGKPPDRIGTVATGEMLGNEPSNSRLVDGANGIPLARQPVSEVRDTAEIDTLGAPRIPPAIQMLTVSGGIRLEDAVLQPSARLRL
jgi:hypothetical protein